MKIGVPWYDNWSNSKKSSSFKNLDSNWRKRIIPDWGHTNDNSQTLKNKRYDKKNGYSTKTFDPDSDSYINSVYYTDWKTNKRISNKILWEINEWVDDYNEWLVYKPDFYDENFAEYNEAIISTLDEDFWKLDFFNFDLVDSEDDKTALRVLIDNRIISIENDWDIINNSTLIFIRDRKWIIMGKIVLKDLFSYISVELINKRKCLNKFIDDNRILVIDEKIKNQHIIKDVLPRELEGTTKMTMYNSKKAA